MAKSEVPMVLGPHGALPFPSHWGFYWRALERRAEELQKVRAKSRANSQRIEELKREVEYQERQLAHQRAVAERHDRDNVDDSYLRKTQEALKKAENRATDLRQAMEMVAQDAYAEIQEHGDAWGAEVFRRIEQENARLEELRQEYQRIMSVRNDLNGLAEFCSGEKMSFNPVDDIRTSNRPAPNPEDQVISARNAGSIT